MSACVSQAPLIAVGLFGVYSVSALAYGLLTFRDCPEEAASLQQVFNRSHGSHDGISTSHAAFTTSLSSLFAVFPNTGCSEIEHHGLCELFRRTPRQQSAADGAFAYLQDIAAARVDLTKRGVLSTS